MFCVFKKSHQLRLAPDLLRCVNVTNVNICKCVKQNPAMDIHIHGYPWINPISWILDISMDIHGYFG